VNQLPTPALYAGGALLVLDGELPAAGFIRELRRGHGPLVAADGAGLRLDAMGIAPEVVIGDLDTIGEKRGLLEEKGAIVIEDRSQETNDFEKGLAWIVARGSAAATVVGIGGGMADHAFNNFSVLAKFARALRLQLRDERSAAYAVPDALLLAARPGDRISLLPLPSARLATSGLVWDLHDESLALGVREGASNRAEGSEVTIRVAEGLILVFHYPRNR
jgi:thiamine pyrophosphokinase